MSLVQTQILLPNENEVTFTHSYSLIASLAINENSLLSRSLEGSLEECV